MRLLSVLIDLLYILVLSPFLLGYVLFLVVVRRRGVGSLAERLGRVDHLRAPDPRKHRVWLHAVSVGEFEAAYPLIQALDQSDRYDVVISTTTASAREVAARRLGAERVFYFPLDLSFVVARTLRKVQPVLMVSMELEIWPNHVLVVHRRGIPFIVANGRVSARGFRRMKMVAAFFRVFLRRIDRFLVQTSTYGERLSALGVASDRIEVMGNLKYDRDLVVDAEATQRALRRRFTPELAGRWWIAGSTHPGEEEAVLDAHAELKERVNGSDSFSLMIAPRHVERAPDVVELVRARGFEVSAFSGLEPAEVIVVDVVGELATLYALGEVAFVGGSLVSVGGHNIVEPLAAGVATLHGPEMSNFAAERQLFTAGGASLEVKDAGDLAAQLLRLTDDFDERKRRSARGLAILAEHRGAAARTVERLDAALPLTSSSR